MVFYIKLSEIKPLSEEPVSSDYLPDAHESIVQAAPHFEDQFHERTRILNGRSERTAQ